MPHRIKKGDYVRIEGFIKNRKPVGIVKEIDGAYFYVSTDEEKDSYETYANELTKITKKEYFKGKLKNE